jgi:hypothetical protein
MPSFKVRSPIQMGTKNDKGELEIKEYNVGDSIELEKDQAQQMSHALEKAPTGMEKMSKEVQAAVQSVRNKPEHRDSGIQLDWKVDDVARNAVSTTRRASEEGIRANEAIGAGYERSNEPDLTSGEIVEGEGVGVRAGDIAPGEEVNEGQKQPPPKGSAGEDENVKRAQTDTKSPAQVDQTPGAPTGAKAGTVAASKK